MEINWKAISAGFLIDFILALLFTWLIPPALISVPVKVIPGLIGGLTAGLMVVGATRGATNGLIATLFVAIILFVSFGVSGFFVKMIAWSNTLGLGIFTLQILSGAVGGFIGGWFTGRRATARETIKETS
ncbi:DUF5518 domain-containing protein [Haladaptatus sp. NG-WS-4]